MKRKKEVAMVEENIKKLFIDRLRGKKAALMVIDVQNDFCHSQGGFSKRKADLSHVQKVVPHINSFIEKCRQFNLPIIFVRTIHSNWTNSPSWLGRMGGISEKIPACLPNSWGSEFYEVKPNQDEYIVTKHRYSAFVGTDLNLILRSKGIETILLSGVATNICVETTGRDGFCLDYNVILVEDCCGAYILEEHKSTLTNISKYFGMVTDSKTVMEVMEQVKK
jgi:ureidoacrylate peracid hydrolase